MKNIVILSFYLFLIASFFFFKKSDKDVFVHESKFERKHQPFDQFYFQRSYPDMEYDVRAYNQSLKEVHVLMQQNLKSGKNGLNADWKQEGPINIGGRLNSIEVHPTNPNIIFTGSAAGGIFKTTNGGNTWTPIADTLSHLAISDITIAPSNINIIYVATGDHNISGLPHVGNGVYKSTDGGITWEQKGLTNECIISRIIVHPTNPNIVYAAAMGLPFLRNNNRGLYKSIDGGTSWTQIHFVSNQAGVIDVVMDPFNSNVLYCAGWDRIRTNQESTVYGPGAKIWKSINGGSSWTLMTSGLPNYNTCRIGLEVSKKTPNTVFAIIVDSTLGLEGVYRTTNAGTNWTKLGTNGMDLSFMGGFGWYFAQIRVNPKNDNHISLLGVEMTTTFNGGLSWTKTVPDWWTYQVHADEHDMVYIDSSKILLATDGGLYRSNNNMNNWSDIDAIPNSQIYRLAISPHTNGVYTGGLQDNGTTSGNASNINSWPREFGGDGFQAMFHPTNSNLRYYETQNGGLWYDDGFSGVTSFDNGINSSDRRNWDMPIIMSKFNASTTYTGTYRIYKQTGAPYGTWYPISNDLTDGVIFGNNFHNISSIGESPLNAQHLYAGTSDGNVWVTTNGGTNWTNVTGSLPDRYVTRVVGSPSKANTFYVTHSGYKYNDNTPHIHITNNNGSTWTSIKGDLPTIAINDVLVYNLNNDSVIFVATDGGVYVTKDAGTKWDRVGGNMPAIPVFDIEIDYPNKKLVAGTFARSIQSFSLDSVFTTSGTITSLSESSETNITVSPNPVAERISINGVNNIKEVCVYSISGKVVMKTSYESVIDVSELPNGNYIIKVSSDTQTFIKKFVKI